MRITILTFLILLINLYSFCQEDNPQYYSVNQFMGEPLKIAPEKDSKQLGLLPYGTKVTIADSIHNEVAEETTGWIKVNAYSWYKLLDSIEQYPASGYVLKSSLDTIPKSEVNINKISESEFKNLYTNALKSDKKTEIQDLDSIKILLGKKVDWLAIGQETTIKSLQTSFGQRIPLNPSNYIEMRVVSYFPEDEILYMVGGHELDLGFSLITGEVTGIPYYIVESPKKLYRLNGNYNGFECVEYFIEKKTGDHWKYYAGFPQTNILCFIKEYYWVTENTFIFTIDGYKDRECFSGEIPIK